MKVLLLHKQAQKSSPTPVSTNIKGEENGEGTRQEEVTAPDSCSPSYNSKGFIATAEKVQRVQTRLPWGTMFWKADIYLFPKNKACYNISQPETKNVTESILTMLSPGEIYSRQKSTQNRPRKVKANMATSEQ